MDMLPVKAPMRLMLFFRVKLNSAMVFAPNVPRNCIRSFMRVIERGSSVPGR